MKEKFIKNELKIKQLEEIFESPIVICTQSLNNNSVLEKEILKELSNNRLSSFKISSKLLKNFLTTRFQNLESFSNNFVNIFYIKKTELPLTLKESLKCLLLIQNKKTTFLILNIFIFSTYLSVKNLDFLLHVLSLNFKNSKQINNLVIDKIFCRLHAFFIFLKLNTCKKGE